MKKPAIMITAVAIGVIAGSVAGLLFAPGKGKDIRKKIAKKGGSVLKNIKGDFDNDKLNKIKNKLEGKLQKVNAKIASFPKEEPKQA